MADKARGPCHTLKHFDHAGQAGCRCCQRTQVGGVWREQTPAEPHPSQDHRVRGAIVLASAALWWALAARSCTVRHFCSLGGCLPRCGQPSGCDVEEMRLIDVLRIAGVPMCMHDQVLWCQNGRQAWPQAPSSRRADCMPRGCIGHVEGSMRSCVYASPSGFF